jgi:thiol-disulfide isomerase/thioredoxin
MLKKDIGPTWQPQQPRPTTLPEWIESVEALKFETDYDTALGKAASEKKIVLAAFTGPTWCPPCIELENEVFSTFEFKAWASSAVVPLRIEYFYNSPHLIRNWTTNMTSTPRFLRFWAWTPRV